MSARRWLRSEAVRASGLSILVLLIFFLIQMAVNAVMEQHEALRVGFAPGVEIATGFMLSVSIMASVPVCMALMLYLRGREIPIRKRLNISMPAIRPLARWLALTVTAGALYIVATLASGRPLVNDFMRYVYDTAYYMPLFALAAGLLGPAFEEYLFREFLFRPIAESRAGAFWAIALTSVTWALIHVQYDLFDKTYILLLGILLGLARQRTGSPLAPFLMHASNNILSIAIVTAMGDRL